MARTVTQIHQQMLDDIAADPTLSVLLTSTSKRAIYRLFTFVVAVSIALLEQLQDLYRVEIETIVSKAAPATAAWLQDQVLRFQYSPDVAQVVQIIDFAPQYPVVDESLRITSRCSVTTDLANTVIIKVATGEPPAAFTSEQLTALQSYVDVIGADGINYIVRSLDPDRLYFKAQIFYNGQYSDVIAANVVQAIDNYLAALPFNGQMRVSDLELAIRAVPGVTDILMQDMAARAASTAFGSGTYLVLNNQVISRLWPTIAGYMVSETEAGNTLADSLQFIPE